jgi:hypothetical protein
MPVIPDLAMALRLSRRCLIVVDWIAIFPAPLVPGNSKTKRRNQDDGSAELMGVKKTGKGRRKIGRKKRKNRSKIRHRK